MNTPTVVRTLLVAGVVAVISVAIEIALAATTGTTAPLLAVLGIVVAAWFGGMPCGLIATACAAALTPLALPPLGSFKVVELTDLVRLAALLTSSSVGISK